MADVQVEKPPVMLLDDPRLFVGPKAWAVIGARKVWGQIYLALRSGDDVKDALFKAWPELIAFDAVSDHFIEADRKQGGKAWAKRVAWWDNTAAQRQQVLEAFSDDYAKLLEALEGKDNGTL